MYKRIFDIIFSLTGLIFAFPIMVIIAVAIRLETPGSVFFSQKRLGLNGKIFHVHKFRKFPVDWGTFGSNVTVANDVRRTAVGSFIERTKLDELPQLWNILKGEMSCVGPRPESCSYADLFTGKYKQLLDFKPGIFGPTQVEFRNEAKLYPADQDPDDFYREVLFPKKAEKDIEYFSKSNFLGELQWIFRGIWVSLIGIVSWKKLLSTYGKIVFIDFLAIEFSWLLTNFLRFGFTIKGHDLETFWIGMLLFPLITLFSMAIGGVYRTPARYFTGHDASRMIIVVSFAWMISSFLLLGLFRRDMSIVLPPISLLCVLFIMSIIRIWHRERLIRSIQVSAGNKTKIVIYGVGYRGTTIANLVVQGFPGTQVIGLIDDRSSMRGRYIGKYKVLGNKRDLDTLQKIHNFQQLWLSFSPTEENLSQIADWCNRHAVKLVVLPELEPFSTLHQHPKNGNYNLQNNKQKITIPDRRNNLVGHLQQGNNSHQITIEDRRKTDVFSPSHNKEQKITIPCRRKNKLTTTENI